MTLDSRLSVGDSCAYLSEPMAARDIKATDLVIGVPSDPLPYRERDRHRAGRVLLRQTLPNGAVQITILFHTEDVVWEGAANAHLAVYRR
ncbi:hypothetical protein ABT115_08870 [Streptomyces sp. NPDC001832]|uniref:hypothetical protein n=1 Tax=Streptomyces sp. NPDC001832 TaxID=3154527 RepID=UPI003327B3C2